MSITAIYPPFVPDEMMDAYKANIQRIAEMSANEMDRMVKERVAIYFNPIQEWDYQQQKTVQKNSPIVKAIDDALSELLKERVKAYIRDNIPAETWTENAQKIISLMAAELAPAILEGLSKKMARDMLENMRGAWK